MPARNERSGFITIKDEVSGGAAESGDRGLAALRAEAEGHHPVGQRYDPGDLSCPVCGDDWPCLVSRLSAALPHGASGDRVAERIENAARKVMTYTGSVYLDEASHEGCRPDDCYVTELRAALSSGDRDRRGLPKETEK